MPTRVVVSNTSKSQPRSRAPASSLHVAVGRPRVDRLELHAKWHAFREAARGWAPSDLDPRHYALSFAFPHEAGVELSYWDDDATEGPLLVGVAIADATPNALSAVYFFYDPAYARRSLGIANVLRHVELARQTGKACTSASASGLRVDAATRAASRRQGNSSAGRTTTRRRAGSRREAQSSSASTLKPLSLITLSCTIGGQTSRWSTDIEKVPLPCVMLFSLLSYSSTSASGTKAFTIV